MVLGEGTEAYASDGRQNDQPTGRPKGGALSERLTISTIRDQIVGVETLVPLFDGTHSPCINFDNASTTPALKPVLDKLNEFMQWYASVGRGAGIKSRLSTKTLEEVRELVYRFVGADPKRHTVIFGKNATEVINQLARRIPFRSGDIVISTAMEHHSNDLPWRAVAQVKCVEVDERGVLDLGHLAHLLNRHANAVRLVAVTGASNVTGVVNPIHDIAEMAHSVGAKLCVDAAQLAPHRSIRMDDVAVERSIDYLAFSAHKMYAPFGIGVLVGLTDLFQEGVPDHVGGGQVDLVTRDHILWSAPPAREEAGTPNIVGAVALGKTILCLQDVGLQPIAAHEAGLTQHLLGRLSRIERIAVYGDTEADRSADRLGVVPFSIEGVPHELVAAILDGEAGIGVRDGLFCAHPYVLRLLNESADTVARLSQELGKGVPVHMPGLTRVSFGMYNTRAEVDVLVEVLEGISRGRYEGQYTQDARTGRFVREGLSFRSNKELFSLGADFPKLRHEQYDSSHPRIRR